LREEEAALREANLFHKMKISATHALKNWAISTSREAIELIPSTIDVKFSKPTPEHRWQRFSIRFKLLLFSLTEDSRNVPKETHSFLRLVTLGQLAIPSEFLINFEKSQLADVIGSDRKLKLPHQTPEIKLKRDLLAAEVDLRKKHITMIIAVYVVSKVLVRDVFNS